MAMTRIHTFVLIGMVFAAGCKPEPSETATPAAEGNPSLPQTAIVPGPAAGDESRPAKPVTQAQEERAAGTADGKQAAPPTATRTAQSETRPSVQPATSGDNVLLITLDTTRADRIGCYGHREAATPVIDSIAARGTLFENAYAQVPITFPSHCSIMTGRYPREHGISGNGGNALAESIPTLAAIFQEHGYQTGGFVSSFVLNGLFGLRRGFDVYQDDMEASKLDPNPLRWEQPGNVVTDRALKWLETAKGRPFFCWVHYFDPHSPYAPPEKFSNIGLDAYDGEIAFMDEQLGRLMRWLESSGLSDRTTVVLMGDHGESLGEHDFEGHALFLYREILHVPFIMAHPGTIKEGQRIAPTVEAVDLFPTILDLMKWDQPGGLLSRSLVPALAGREIESKPAYAESMYALETLGWSEQRSLQTDRWKYVSSSRPQLFDHQEDPGEARNLVQEKPDVAAQMREYLVQRFDQMEPGRAQSVELDPKAKAINASLPYFARVASGEPTDFLTENLPDPKDHLDVIDKLKVVRALIRQGQASDALPLLYDIWAVCPNSFVAESSLGESILAVVQQQEKSPSGKADPDLVDEALQHFMKATELKPNDAQSWAGAGHCFMRRKQFDQAIYAYRTAAQGAPMLPNIHLNLGTALKQRRLFSQALFQFEKAVEANPDSKEAHFDAGVILANAGQFNDALDHYYEVVRIDPQDKVARYNLGVTLLKLEQYSDARQELTAALHIDPNYGDALINVAIADAELGNIGAANAKLIRATNLPDVSAPAFHNLAILAVRTGHNKQGIDFCMKAISADPTYTPPIDEVVGTFLDNGRIDKAVGVLRTAVEHNPQVLRYSNLLAQILATSRQDDIRNGPEAVQHATHACQLVRFAAAEPLATLASAYAEAGDFAQALQWINKAIEAARKTQQDDVAAKFEQRRKQFFELGDPYRDARY